ncbi:sensor domain-containing diguanylate cyclase [Paenibacillus aceris]|uniref:Diguanylate cyclase (GGDEF)-like protein n=1 Tax=Paenibacillus aceris TaxID=869555 RepID=A0ABS4I7K0_9BACL|nr:diguanylate cyclase [Paenibacillus aceris]MBP1966902.1 diguanylate cyclase (GGDEF)-like protein [Paenibacillus aceris]NHW38973.1 diguanylate cyclase [Paenibacillus aceris]
MGRKFAYFSSQSMKMRFQLWIGVAIAALAFSIIVPFYWIEKKNRINEAESQLKQMIVLQSLYIERWNQEKLDAIKRFALSDNAKFHRIGDLKREFQNYAGVNSEFDTLNFVEKDGVINAGDDSFIYVGDRPFFKYALEKRSFISGVDISRETGKPIITFSAPVLGDQNEFKGVVMGVITLDRLNMLMKQLSFGETGEVYVLDAKGQIVTASGNTNVSSTSPNPPMTSEIIQRAKTGSTSSAVYTGFHGEKVFGQYQWSTGKNWIVVGEITQKEVFQKLNQLSITIIVISFIALIVSILAAITIASRIERPIRYLLRATQHIRKGNYHYQIDADEIRSAPVELRLLVNTFNLMSEKLKTTISLLEVSALVDQLTDIPNRRYMMSEGNEQLKACIAAGYTCSVMMMDIDHFKKVNDTYGHLVGDRVLQQVATLLKQLAGNHTVVARYGGEEFILLCLRKNAEESARLAEEIRARVEMEPYKDDKVTVQLTVSIGAAEFSPKLEFGTMVLEDMISRADHALYRAKTAGRNRVELDR